TERSAGELPTVSVARHERRREVLPDVGNVVLCRVVRLVPKQAIVSIQQVGGTVLDAEWQGVIRAQDVRATEKDKVKIHESFKPGDTVRAQVVRFRTLIASSPFLPLVVVYTAHYWPLVSLVFCLALMRGLVLSTLHFAHSPPRQNNEVVC